VLEIYVRTKKVVVSQNLHQAHLLEVGLTKVPGDHETLSIVCHVGLHVDFSSMKSSLGLYTFTYVCEVKLGRSPPFRLMRAFRLQWSLAFNLACEVALTPSVSRKIFGHD
jgi:hypothetical protein